MFTIPKWAVYYSPHLCVGFLFLVLYPAVRPSASRPSSASTHSTHNFAHLTQFVHTSCHHTTCSHTLSSHILSSHNLLTYTHTHTLSSPTCPHTTCSHTTCPHTPCPHQLVLTQLAHTQLALAHLVITQLALTQLLLTQLVLTQLAHTHNLLTHNLSTYNFPSQTQLCVAGVAGVAGVALSGHGPSLLRGRRGTYGTGLAPVAPLGRSVTRGRRGCWRGRRGTWRHPPSFHVTGVVLGDIDFHFCVAGVARMALGWLRWRAWAGVGRGDAAAVGVAGRCTWRHPPSFHVTGVVLGDIDFHFCVAGVARMALGWLRWRAWAGVGRGDAAAVGVAGRCTWRHPPSFHVTGVVLGDIDFHFCVAGVARMALGWLRWRAWAGVGRRDAAAVGVAGVALGDIHLRFTWQAVLGDIDFHFCVAGVARMALGWLRWRACAAGTPRLLAWQAWHLETSTFVSRGRRYLVTSTATFASFAWQAWHVWHWAGSDGALGPRGRRSCWRGRRGTWKHPPSFHVAGVALGDIDIHLRFTWHAWYLVTSTSTFAWQAWHVWHWAGSDGALGPELDAGTLRLLACRRGIWRYAPWFHVAGVALGDIDIYLPLSFLPSGMDDYRPQGMQKEFAKFAVA